MPNLQILRFVAAALVLISHVQHEALKRQFLDLSHFSPWEFIYFAGGVDIFFVISGFIMYAIASRDFGKQGAALKFTLRRLSRIVPPYWIFTTAMIAAAIVFSDHVTHSALKLDHIIASYFFYPFENAYGKAYPMLMLGWTLNYEFFFYVVFGAALCFSRKIGLLLVFGVIGMFGVLGGLGFLPKLPFMFWGNPIVFEFLFGISLAMLREKGVRLSRPLSALAIAAGVIAMLVTMKMGIAANYWDCRFLWMGIPALLICAGVVLAKHESQEATGIKAFFVLLGDASYAIYLSHPFALNAVVMVCAKVGLHNAWIYVAIACLVSLVVGLVVHVLIEKPLTGYLNRQVDQRFGHRWGRGALPATA